MTAHLDAELRPLNGHYLAATLDNHGYGEQIVHAQVYADPERQQFLGLIQSARADGSAWMVSLGEGWLTDVQPADIYDAVDTLARMRAELEGTTARLRRLMDAARTPELRADVRGLINDLAAARMNTSAVRLAAANLQTEYC